MDGMRWGGIVVTTVLVCEARRVVRAGLVRMMSAVAGVRRVECVTDGDELLARYSCQPVDLVLVGTQRALPAGVDTLRRLVVAYPQARVIVFGAADDVGGIAAAVAGGAQGYLRWGASAVEVLAILAHALTTTALPPTPSPPRPHRDQRSQLSERELQVLHGMSQGKSNAQIGRELFLAQDTIKTHARRMFSKLGVKDRAEAVAHGFRHGLVS
jgi:DNA-binding NarL/FixJ family response regulator